MMAGRDTKSRYQGVFGRHSINCPKTPNPKAKCKCSPRYYGAVYDKQLGRVRRTTRFDLAIEARNARNDLLKLVESGVPLGRSDMTVEDATERMVQAARDGVFLNKHGRRYQDSAVVNLESSLNRLPESMKDRRLDIIAKGDVQRLIDSLLGEGLSGSRIRSIVNSLRALYRYAVDRDFALADPSANIRLPALNSVARDRVATPTEMVALIDALPIADRPAWAIAAYTSARASEIRRLDWTDVDLKRGMIRLPGQKSEAAMRILPIVSPLLTTLRAEHLRQGRPDDGKVCPPRRASKSGMFSTNMLLKRGYRAWEEAKLTPIKLHECRHTCATWLDHAGVSPKVVSVWMGHATPGAQPGAASITLRLYTHILDGELVRAGQQLDQFIADRLEADREVSG
ncbi:MAG TPA: site-specific integrase [Solirubrobacterales bacterium]|nr:site-specific integrase [Solirubrobacterales bacterium]